MRARALGSGAFYAGLSANPHADPTPTSIERGFLINGPSVRIVEFGTARPGSHALDGYVWIRRTGDTLEYLSGTAIGSATVKRTVVAGAPLYFDSSLATPDVALEVLIETPGSGSRKRRPLLSLGFGL